MDYRTSRQLKKIGETHLNAKIQMLEDLIEETKQEGYETFSQLNGSIQKNLDILTKMRNENDQSKLK